MREDRFAGEQSKLRPRNPEPRDEGGTVVAAAHRAMAVDTETGGKLDLEPHGPAKTRAGHRRRIWSFAGRCHVGFCSFLVRHLPSHVRRHRAMPPPSTRTRPKPASRKISAARTERFSVRQTGGDRIDGDERHRRHSAHCFDPRLQRPDVERVPVQGRPSDAASDYECSENSQRARLLHVLRPLLSRSR